MGTTVSSPRAKPTAAASPQAAPARPFLKWAGGKGQLLESLSALFPPALTDGSVHTYAEPFLGGGAMFFHVLQTYPIRSAHLLDANEELVVAYSVVQRDVETLIAELKRMGSAFLKLDMEARKERYLKVRDSFNREKALVDFQKYSASSWVKRAAQILFLNRTCYNGLFRVNRAGGFNVPFGSYANPAILDADNLRAASGLLGRASVHLSLGDFGDLESRAGLLKSGTFVYYDPPYLPISPTASFTAYSRTAFGEDEQRRLAALFHSLDRPGVYQMLSNSDPKNVDPLNHFFEDLYAPYRDTLFRVPASRAINSDPARRGLINEIVITNYRPEGR
ncbi:MAG TPA: Dam family site-specific DNA-(adenine-N6)-methyltransferase [Fibrobacteria bacterium]|nr:Dam family site-specific DNA-(adenine-N6)-methyltransferase [Fibrobacteria bacterium]